MKTLHIQQYQCTEKDCKKIWTHEEWSDQDPEKIIPLICDDCGEKTSTSVPHVRDYHKFTPNQNARLAGGKTWERDIKARRQLPDGTVGRFREDGKRIG